jgi:hypothetical protein
MDWRKSSVIRLVRWVNVLDSSFLQRCCKVVMLDRSADAAFSVRPTPFGPSSRKYWMPMAVARKGKKDAEKDAKKRTQTPITFIKKAINMRSFYVTTTANVLHFASR